MFLDIVYKPVDLKKKTDSAILYIKTAIIGRRLLFLVSPILSFSLRPGGGGTRALIEGKYIYTGCIKK